VSADVACSVGVILSVIIPTLDRVQTAELLAIRIRELLPALSVEVIIVTPRTGERGSVSDSVRHVADSRQGIYAAYTAGLRVARGEYVWFLGDDDYPLNGVTAISNLLREGTFDLLIAPVLFSSGRIYRPQRTLLLLHFLNWCQQGVIYRRQALLRHRFYRRLPVQADQYVNILMSADPSIRKKFISEPICVFGVNGLSRRLRDAGYRSLRPALARRTLGFFPFLAFRLLTVIEPLFKVLFKVR
jgi:glycosyltransferase involved in cell wall biosynthesis